MIRVETSGAAVLKNAHPLILKILRKTFCSILIEGHGGTLRVLKAADRWGVREMGTWEFSAVDEVTRLIRRRVRDKTDPSRRSDRKYCRKPFCRDIPITEQNKTPTTETTKSSGAMSLSLNESMRSCVDNLMKESVGYQKKLL